LQRGALEIRILPFVEQDRYDSLLWLCDLNFVRGEDSFVRAAMGRAANGLAHLSAAGGGASDQARCFSGTLLRDAAAGDGELPLCEFWQAWNAGRVETAQALAATRSVKSADPAA
jgi:hypothetical protein